MKKRSKTLIAISLVLALAVVIAAMQSEKTEPVVIEVGDDLGVHDDWRTVTNEECFERAELVVRGKYEGLVNGFPFIIDGRPVQFFKFQVEEIYKGACSDTLILLNAGGEVNVKDYVIAAEREGILGEKVGPPLSVIDLFREDYPDLNVVYRWKDESTFVPEQNQEYLVFLNWFDFSDIRGMYAPMNALYGKRQMVGVRKINEDGQVQNPYSYRYETLDFM